MSKLKEQRIKKGLTQQDLANFCNMGIRTIQNLEQGIRDINNCNLYELSILSYYLKCTIFDLIEDETLIEIVQSVL